jgi:hypothetical protein
MIARARNGELHLSNSLWGFARRERSPELTMRKRRSEDGGSQ